MYKVKEVARRGSALVAAVGLFAGIGASALPTVASADALNPLTERSLALSSSSPGWAYTDGSGNSTYAGPNTGTNGLKTGNTFGFRVTSSATIKGFTFQYCTTPAGLCASPGNDTPAVYQTAPFDGTTITTPRGSDDVANFKSDLKIVTDATVNSEVSQTDYTNTLSLGAGPSFGQVKQVPDAQDTVSPYDYRTPHGGTNMANGIAGNFVVLYGSAATGHVDSFSSGWSLSSSNVEDATINSSTGATTRTGKKNMMTLSNSGAGLTLAPGDYVKVIFFGTDKNYITNPGKGAFYVKINDYNDASTMDNSTLVDGGVTVANVMNQSIQIQTKVLETMDFSVGTVDPDTLTAAELSTATAGDRTAHGQCDPILTAMNPSDPQNVLSMGNTDAENSLETDNTFATHSYWRLSSNSSGGATVYYAGNTLSNTEGDKITAIGTAAANPLTGSEQFGLALDNATTGNRAVDYNWAQSLASVNYEAGADGAAASGGAALGSDWNAAGITGAHDPQLSPLIPTAAYGGGLGKINSGETGSTTSSYAFDPNSQTIPTAIASEATSVVNCVTGKMRYIGNIAATTPAGIYTTKINYIAAPEY